MKSPRRFLALSVLLLLPMSAAYALEPIVSPISDFTVNAGTTTTVNVVAIDPDLDAITLTSSLPSFVTLNPPTTGTGLVSTTLTVSPVVADVGTQSGSVTATAGGQTHTETFQITVAASGANQAPAVTAPAVQDVTEGNLLSFTVTASDPDADAITSLDATGLPTGATFTSNVTYTSGTFSWTPSTSQAGDYDVIFTAANTLSGSATTHIHVIDSGTNDPPTVTAPATQSVNEGQNLTFGVTATDPDGDHVTLTASGVPSGATFNDQGNNTGTFAWTPSFTQSGTYAVIFNGNDGHGGTGTATTTITVNNVSTGGAGEATASLMGRFMAKKKFVCFRIRPVNGSFDLRDVILSSITIQFQGDSINALAGKTHLMLDCDEEDVSHDEDCDDGDDEECDCDDDHDDNDTDVGCEVESIRACFSMQDMKSLFGDADVPGNILLASLRGRLTNGQIFVATFDPARFTKKGNHGHEGNKGNHGKKAMSPSARPNPLNPRTELKFTLSEPGRVRVAVYDLQGRLVKTLLDESRNVGEQTVTWDGSNSRSGKVASGVYFFRIQAPQGEEVQRVSVVK